jgi:hypothetical protein
VKSQVTVPFAFKHFTMMINSLSSTVLKELFTKCVLQGVAFPAMRRNAAKKVYVKRKHPALYSLNFTLESDVRIVDGGEEFGLILCIRRDIDKRLPAGREYWGYVPNKMKCGLTPVSDWVTLWTTYPVPDGPWICAPTKNGQSWSKKEYTNLDGMLARAWASTFPDRVEEKIAPHSLRKMTIQMLYDWLKLTGKFCETDIGEFVGWLSVKTSVRPHYADLSMMEYCRMIACRPGCFTLEHLHSVSWPTKSNDPF